MTDEEANVLNLEVAAAMGWTLWGPEDHVWDTPGGRTVHHEDNFNGLPDFCRDVLAIGYLMEWANQQYSVEVNQCNAPKWLAHIMSADGWSFSGSGACAGEALWHAIVTYAIARKEKS